MEIVGEVEEFRFLRVLLDTKLWVKVQLEKTVEGKDGRKRCKARNEKDWEKKYYEPIEVVLYIS